MLAKVATCAVIGLDGALVEVEVDIGNGLPSFAIVGLPDTAVNEAKERVRAAIRNSGATFPLRRITVNLAPADLRKAGPAYDLPIAIGILIAGDQITPAGEQAGGEGSTSGSSAVVPFITERCLFLGELGLDGQLRHTRGILSMVMLARELGIAHIFLPAIDAPEAALVGKDLAIYPVEHLLQLIAHMRGDQLIPPYASGPTPEQEEALVAVTGPEYVSDLADVRGQEH